MGIIKGLAIFLVLSCWAQCQDLLDPESLALVKDLKKPKTSGQKSGAHPWRQWIRPKADNKVLFPPEDKSPLEKNKNTQVFLTNPNLAKWVLEKKAPKPDLQSSKEHTLDLTVDSLLERYLNPRPKPLLPLIALKHLNGETGDFVLKDRKKTVKNELAPIFPKWRQNQKKPKQQGRFRKVSLAEGLYIGADKVGAIKRIKSRIQKFNHAKKYKPKALNFELACRFYMGFKAALKYQGVKECDLFLSNRQYGMELSYKLFQGTSIGLQYLQGDNHGIYKREMLTAQLSIEF